MGNPLIAEERRKGMPALVRCPFHDDSTPSLALYGDHAYCFGGCGLVPLEWLPEGYLERAKEEAERERREGKSKGLPPGDLAVLVEVWHWQLLEGPRRHRLSWLAQRGLDEVAAKRFKLGHTGAWFVIPVLDSAAKEEPPLSGPKVQGVRFRRDDLYAEEEAPKYRSPKGQSSLLFRPNPGGWPLVVCEGEFDAMLLALAGCDAVTSTAGAGGLVRDLERAGILRWFRRRGEWLEVATDLDPAGEQVARALEARGIRVHRWAWDGGKDISEVLSGLPRERWRAWVRSRLKGSGAQAEGARGLTMSAEGSRLDVRLVG